MSALAYVSDLRRGDVITAPIAGRPIYLVEAITELPAQRPSDRDRFVLVLRHQGRTITARGRGSQPCVLVDRDRADDWHDLEDLN